MTFDRALGGQLLRESETPQPFMNPTHERSLASLPAEKLPHLFQNRVHYALGTYLNGTDDPDFDLVYRVADELDVDLPDTGTREQLVESHRWLAAELERGTETRRIRVDPFDPAEYGRNDLEAAICDIATRLEAVDDLLVSAVLHGSFGDRTYVRNYSDVDLLLVVRWDMLGDEVAVERLRDAIRHVQREAYYVDPHQHHGVQVVTDLDLAAYNRAYIPAEVLAEGTALCGETALSFSYRDDELERTYGFWRNVQRLRRTVDDNEFPVDFQGRGNLQPDLSGHLYSLKYFTSFVMLQPSMYLLADGRPMYKADSFDTIPDSGEAETILGQCSEVRCRYPDHVTFDRSDAYRRQVRDDPAAARADQQSAIPSAFRDTLDGRPFARALEFIEQLWTRLT